VIFLFSEPVKFIQMDYSTPVRPTVPNDARWSKARFFAKVFTSIIFLLFIARFEGQAQSAHPSCNISGPLEATASGPDIVITVEIAHSTATPKIDYEFISNSSGASIRKRGPVVYDAAKNTSTQQLTVSPGSRGLEFNLRLKVVTANGSSECSKSVSVSQ
jgi:hypothetical protein